MIPKITSIMANTTNPNDNQEITLSKAESSLQSLPAPLNNNANEVKCSVCPQYSPSSCFKHLSSHSHSCVLVLKKLKQTLSCCSSADRQISKGSSRLVIS